MSDAGDIQWMKLAEACVATLGLLAALAWALKYFAMNGMKLPGQTSNKRRLKIVEILPVDTRRRLVIVSCDEREHLLLLGAGQDIVVEANLSPAPKSS